jgi:hypothetical protein
VNLVIWGFGNLVIDWVIYWLPDHQIPKSPNTMNIDVWLKTAVADAEERGLPELKPMLETLAQATRALRAAGFPDDPRGVDSPAEPSHDHA